MEAGPHEMQPHEMWEEFVDATGAGDGFEPVAFGETVAQQDELAGLAAAGTKQATAGVYLDYLEADERLPQKGDHWVVVDGSGSARCIVKVTEVAVRRFGDVDGAFARREGEGDRSLDHWRRVHLEAFPAVDDDTLMVLVEFVKVWPVPPPPDDTPAAEPADPEMATVEPGSPEAVSAVPEPSEPGAGKAEGGAAEGSQPEPAELGSDLEPPGDHPDPGPA